MKLLLDLQQLSAEVRAACESAENELYLSAVSVWEIAVKWAARRLVLPEEPTVWIPRRRTQNGIEALPVTEDAAAQMSKLPPLHKDPFDRMLVCQAITEGLQVVTPDHLIRQYPVRVLWSCIEGERFSERSGG